MAAILRKQNHGDAFGGEKKTLSRDFMHFSVSVEPQRRIHSLMGLVDDAIEQSEVAGRGRKWRGRKLTKTLDLSLRMSQNSDWKPVC